MDTIRIRIGRLVSSLNLMVGVVAIIFLVSCERDEIIKVGGIGPNCDTNNVSFQQFIQPLIDRNCKGCHNSSKQFGGVNLESYISIKAVAQSGKLVNSLYRNMGAYISSECDKAKIQAWVNQGLKDN